MDNVAHRSERVKRAKRIFSPSNPLQPYYYLVTHDGPERFQIVGRTSIQRIRDDKALLHNADSDVQIIACGRIRSLIQSRLPF